MLYPTELQARQEVTIHQAVIRRPRRSFSFRSRRDVRIVSIVARGDVGRITTHEEEPRRSGDRPGGSL